LSEAKASPNYQTLLDVGDARSASATSLPPAERPISKRLRSYAATGVTDSSARVVPIGEDPDERRASLQRTRESLASQVPSLTRD
jgi:hypothetical protein